MSEKDKFIDYLDALDIQTKVEITEGTKLYRYLNEIGLEKTVKDNKMIFRFSNYNNFKDKTEGKIIQKYYNKAIKNLYNKKTIDRVLYQRLQSINLPEDNMFVEEDEKYVHFHDKEYKAYIYCFSKTKIINT